MRANSLGQQHSLAAAVCLACGASTVAADFRIEEVIVTAQKREQSLQEVPVAVSAFSDDFMARAGVDNVNGLVALTPGLGGATSDSYIDAMSIRGVSTNDFGVGGDPSIGIFQDGFWAGRNGGVTTEYFDIERAEVVKGPQATLFGRNAIAGAISITTKKPIEEFEGKISGGIAENNHINLTGTVNVPLTDSLFFRGSVYGADGDGWLENLAGGDDYGMRENSGTRLALRYAEDNVDATLTASYEDRKQNSSIYWDATNTQNLSTPKDKANSELLGEAAIDESEIASIVANVTVDLNESMTLTSITGWKTFNSYYIDDQDATAQKIAQFYIDTGSEYMSQELRLNVDNGESFTWFAGVSVYKESIDATTGYFFDEDELCAAISRTDTDDFPGGPVADCSDPAFWQDYWGETAAPAPGDTLDNAHERNIVRVESDGWAVFFDTTWHVTEALNITYGARHTSDSKEMGLRAPDTGGWLGNNLNTLFPIVDEVSDDETWSELTQRIALDYVINEEVSFYANFSEGYKSGGFGTYGVDDVTGLPSRFDPELIDSYEVGLKSQLLDNRLNVNAALYFYEYEDMQLSYFGDGSYQMANIGAAESTGVELDVRYLPLENLDLYLTLSYQDSDITEDASLTAVGACDACNSNSLPMSPELSASLIATYTIPMDGGEYFITAEHFFQDKQYADLDNQESIAQSSWTETNLRLGYDSAEEWRVILWIENLFSREHFERGWAFEGYGFNNLQASPARPRTVGLDFQMSFR